MIRAGEVEDAALSFCQVLAEDSDSCWPQDCVQDVACAAAGVLSKRGYEIVYPTIVLGTDGIERVEEVFEEEEPITTAQFIRDFAVLLLMILLILCIGATAGFHSGVSHVLKNSHMYLSGDFVVTELDGNQWAHWVGGE